jgi:hypothetical protein
MASVQYKGSTNSNKVYRGSRVLRCGAMQFNSVSEQNALSIFRPIYCDPNDAAAGSSETLVTVYQIPRSHVPEDSSLYIREPDWGNHQTPRSHVPEDGSLYIPEPQTGEPTRLHGVTCQKTAVFTFVNLRLGNPPDSTESRSRRQQSLHS